MKKTCAALEQNQLTFNSGYFDKILGLCCGNVIEEQIPGVDLEDTPEASFRNWENLVTKVIEESNYDLCDRTVSKACFYCPKLVSMESNRNEKINFINFFIYPSPCQSDCIYCGLRANGSFDMSDTEAINTMYSRVIALCNYLKENNKLDDNVVFQMASGEITIHPFKREILDMLGDMTTIFSSNCMKFDEEIAEKLRRNPQSKIDMSLDCGTSETWKIIKRRDNFQNVLENLEKYRKYTTEDDQLQLKYIVLPGVNTSDEDFDGIVKIMKLLNVPKLVLSRDFGDSSENRSDFVQGLKRLVKALVMNDLGWDGQPALFYEDIKMLEEYEISLKEIESNPVE